MKTYNLLVSYQGPPSYLYDKKIEKVIGKEYDGSGYGFGERDLSFHYNKKRDVIDSQKKIGESGLELTDIRIIEVED